jgi:hypothetical protein
MSDVLVINTDREPVPVEVVSGRFSGDVGVVNDPTVHAKQEGAWNVGITGTPSVRLDAKNNTVKLDPAASTVRVSSSKRSPVYVNVTNPGGPAAKQPYQVGIGAIIEDGELEGHATLIPSWTKWLVIETVSVTSFLPASQWPLRYQLLVLSANGSGIDVMLTPTSCAYAGALRHWFINAAPCTLYVEPKQTLRWSAWRDGTSATERVSASVMIFGYLTDQL